MDYTIVTPQEGKVTLVLDWNEAEIVTRLLGMVNTGNLQSHSPNLSVFIDSMVENFGRNVDGEASRYIAKIRRDSQVYLIDTTTDWT